MNIIVYILQPVMMMMMHDETVKRRTCDQVVDDPEVEKPI